jgi:hypothetical protein
MPTVIDAATGRATALEPVKTSVQKLPTDEDMPVITVQADRIPWYAWLGAGFVVGFVVARMIDR